MGLRSCPLQYMFRNQCACSSESDMDHLPAETPERKAFYTWIDKQNMTALWTVMNALITPEPKSQCVPAVWHFDDIRAAMLEAGTLITAKEAERRVLILENPGLRGQSKVTTSLYAGRDDEIAGRHVGALAVDGGEGALALDDKPERGLRVPMGRRHFVGHHQLHAGDDARGRLDLHWR
jgi:hypothetical protein